MTMRNTKNDYLMKFRRCQCLDTLEKVYLHMQERVPTCDDAVFNSAYDHRKAEIAVGTVYDKIPPGVWRFVS